MRTISRIRVRKYAEQGGLCHYCRQPMWEAEPDRFAQINGLSKRRVEWLRSTAEHLRAQSDGGGDHADNIVAACAYCNWHRHRSSKPLAPEAYGERVRLRLVKGKWHGLSLR